jgi:hypothetical protein
MSRALIVAAVYIVAMPFAVQAQTPGINQRGLAAASAPIIIGVVEEPWQTVIRPSMLPKIGPVRPQPNGTYSVELPKGPFNYLVGYIVRVRVQEVLKHDKWVRANQTIEIFAPLRLEGGLSLPIKQRFLLALTPFSPKRNDFENTSVIKAGQSMSQQGRPFDLRTRYYVVAGEANGAVAITDKNQKLIAEIRAAISAH